MNLTLDQPATRPAPVGWPATVRRTVHSEFIKLRAIRSYGWLMGVATAFTLALGPIQTLGVALAGTSDPPASTPVTSAVSTALTGAGTASLLLGVLGVLVVTGEYTSHAIRTTFTLVPQRRQVVLAKALAVAISTAATTLIAVTVAVMVSFAILDDAGLYSDLQLSWGSEHVLRIAAATVWYLVGWGVLGLAAGWLTRSKIGGAAVLIGIMYLLPPLLGLLPERIARTLIALMPSSAGDAMMSVGSAGQLGSPLVGFAIWTAYLVFFTALSAWLVARRDA